ncbi:hypothetical protein [Aeromonas veronii]|uniref:hypothetical protein n=1 Tax=Aeromonas veronii TaxID=654 RepID=UPI0032ED65CB
MEKVDKAEFNKEKEYIWKKLSELDQKLTLKASSEALNNLEKIIPESLKVASQSSKMTSEYRNRAQKAQGEAEQAKSTIDNIKSESELAFERINEIDNLSVLFNEKLKALITNANCTYEDLTTTYDESIATVTKLKAIAQEHDALVETIESIQLYKEEGDSNHGKIKTILSQAAALKKDIDDVHDEIFGYESNDSSGDTSTRVEGLRDKLTKTYKDLRADLSKQSVDIEEHKNKANECLKELELNAEKSYKDYVSSCNASHDDVLQRINKLLPRAMTAGLASAYNDKIETEIEEQKKHEKSFNKTIFYLFLISLIPFAINAYRLFGSGDNLIVIIKDTPYLLSAMLPLYIPVLWLAYTTNKNYKLSKRLIEEYTHKGVVSKTFEGLSHQIDELEDQAISGELRVKLLFNIVSVNTENPGKLISNYDKSDHPLMDALDKSAQLADAVTKLSKIPGFSAIAKKLDDQANQIVADKTDKINSVLNTDIDGTYKEEAKNTASKDSPPGQAA